MSRGLWIPGEVLGDRSLTPMEKLFLAEIDHLHNVKGCLALNAHFAARFRIGKSRASQIISSLVGKKRISCSLQYDGKKIVGRTITPLGNLKAPLCRKPKDSPLEDSSQTPLEKREDTKQYTKQREGKPHTSTRFIHPNPQEVTAYAESIGYPLDGNRFVDFYEARGWMIGKNRMRSWKAAVRTWQRRDDEGAGTKVKGDNMSGLTHEATPEEIEALQAEGVL